MAHVMEMTGQYDDGLRFLDSTINGWQVIDLYHMSLLHNGTHCTSLSLIVSNVQDVHLIIIVIIILMMIIMVMLPSS